MKNVRFLTCALILALCGSLLVVPGTVARQGAGCEGIDEYIEAINSIGNPVTAPENTNTPEGFINDWDADELAAALEEMQRIQGELEGVEPPPAAETFHATLIEVMGVFAELIDAVAVAGIEANFEFSDELNSLVARIYADGLAVEESCQVALLDHDLDGETEVGVGAGISEDIPTVAAPTETAPETPPSRSAPVPVWMPGFLTDGWVLTVMSVTPDATAEVLAYDPSNTPPEDGFQYFIARVSVRNLTVSEGSFSNWRLSIEDPSGRTYAPFIDYCGFIEDELTSETIAPGESAEGNVCWAIPSAEAASPTALVMFDSDASPEERVYFSLDDPADAGAPGSMEDSESDAFTDAVGTLAERTVPGSSTPQADAERRSR